MLLPLRKLTSFFLFWDVRLKGGDALLGKLLIAFTVYIFFYTQDKVPVPWGPQSKWCHRPAGALLCPGHSLFLPLVPPGFFHSMRIILDNDWRIYVREQHENQSCHTPVGLYQLFRCHTRLPTKRKINRMCSHSKINKKSQLDSLKLFQKRFLLGELQKMYSTKLTVSHSNL